MRLPFILSLFLIVPLVVGAQTVPTITALDWSPKGDEIALGTADGAILIQNASLDETRLTLQGHSGAVLVLHWSPDGIEIASAGEDGAVLVWDAESGDLIHRLEQHTQPVFALAWANSGTRLASASQDSTVQLWDNNRGSAAHQWEFSGIAPQDLAWSPRANLLAVSLNDNSIQIWDTRSNALSSRLGGHPDEVRRATWTSDGSKLVALSSESWVWDVTNETPLSTIPLAPDARYLALAPDDSRFAVGYADRVVVYSTIGGTEQAALEIDGTLSALDWGAMLAGVVDGQAVLLEPSNSAAPPFDLSDKDIIFDGEQIFLRYGCSSCHTNFSAGAPPMPDIAANAATRRAEMSAHEYLFEAIWYPDAFIVAGYPRGIHPSYYVRTISEENVWKLVAYLLNYPY